MAICGYTFPEDPDGPVCGQVLGHTTPHIPWGKGAEYSQARDTPTPEGYEVVAIYSDADAAAMRCGPVVYKKKDPQ